MKQLSDEFEEIVQRTPNRQHRGKENLLPLSTADMVQVTHEIENLSSFQGFKQKLNKPSLTRKAFLRFITTCTLACPPKLRNLLVVLLFEALLGQLVALGSPFDLQPKCMDSDIMKVSLSFGQASMQLLPMIIWTSMFMLILVYTTILIWPFPLRVPMISLLLLAPPYYFSVLSHTLSGFEILIGSNEVPGFWFAMFAALVIVFLLISCLLTLAAFASWQYINGEGERSS